MNTINNTTPTQPSVSNGILPQHWHVSTSQNTPIIPQSCQTTRWIDGHGTRSKNKHRFPGLPLIIFRTTAENGDSPSRKWREHVFYVEFAGVLRQGISAVTSNWHNVAEAWDAVTGSWERLMWAGIYILIILVWSCYSVVLFCFRKPIDLNPILLGIAKRGPGLRGLMFDQGN